MEFVSLGDGRALVVIVGESGSVENRIIEVPAGLPPSALVEAANYLNARLRGATLAETRREIMAEIEGHRAELDEVTARVVESGLAIWGGGGQQQTLIVRGRANLLEDISAAEDLERVRQLFADLESKQALIDVLELAHEGPGVRVLSARKASFSP